jgi:transposase
MHLSEAMRQRAVDMVERQHLSRAEAAQALHVSPQTVRNTMAHFHRTGHFHDDDHPGAPRAYDEEDMETLRDFILQHRNATAAGLLRLMGPSAPSISERTIRRYRRELNMTPHRGRITAKQSGKHHEARKAWAWEHRRDDATKWVHFDESTLCMRDTGDIVWAPRGEDPPPLEVDKLRCHVNVWGMVWDQGSAFAQYDGHLNTDSFIDILEQHLLPHKENLGDRFLLIDRHPVHRTKRVDAWLKAQGFKYHMLPTHSPQFNAIEKCWSWIKRFVRQGQPQDEESMRAEMEAACDALPLDVITANLREANNNIHEYAYND